MNYLTINIAIILVSATVLHFLLFKKSLRGEPKRNFFPARSYKEGIVEVFSIILLLGVIAVSTTRPPLNSFFLVCGLGVVLILIYRMVRHNDR